MFSIEKEYLLACSKSGIKKLLELITKTHQNKNYSLYYTIGNSLLELEKIFVINPKLEKYADNTIRSYPRFEITLNPNTEADLKIDIVRKVVELPEMLNNLKVLNLTDSKIVSIQTVIEETYGTEPIYGKICHKNKKHRDNKTNKREKTNTSLVVEDFGNGRKRYTVWSQTTNKFKNYQDYMTSKRKIKQIEKEFAFKTLEAS